MRRNLMALIIFFLLNNNCFASNEFFYRTEVDEYLNTAILLITVNDKYKEIFQQSKYLIVKSDKMNETAYIPIDLSYKNGMDLWAVGVIPFYDDWKITGSDHKMGLLLKHNKPIEQFSSLVKLNPESYLGTSDEKKYFRKYGIVKCKNNTATINIEKETENNYLLVVIFSEKEGIIDQYNDVWKNIVNLKCLKEIKKVAAMSRSYKQLYSKKKG